MTMSSHLNKFAKGDSLIEEKKCDFHEISKERMQSLRSKSKYNHEKICIKYSHID
jgi:hypothetical protein